MQSPPNDRATSRPHASFTPEAITDLVHSFYGRVQADEFLGPVFAKRIESWPPHLARMVLFWRSVLGGEALFIPQARGGPPVLHRAIDELSMTHFTRWLELFEQTAREVFPEDVADVVLLRAQRIGMALSSHLDGAETYRWA